MAFGRKKRQQAEDEAPREPRARLTPVDVQQRVFRLAFRGYNEQDVDQFLDEVTEDLAFLHEENKRLTEELELRAPGGGAEEARRHAEGIIRRAREEAARLTSGAASGGGPAPPSFLVREREFLRQLAGLVQGHAEVMKAEARRARGQHAVAPEQAPEAQEEIEEDEPEPAPEEQREPEPAPEEQPEPEPAPEEQPESQPAALDETAPMAVGEEGGLAEWSNPFVSDEPGAAPADDEEEGEPSLRELFWGEE